MTTSSDATTRVAERVEAALVGDVRPRLQSHMGDVALAGVEPDGTVHLVFGGACTGCPAKPSTAALGVAPVVEALEGVSRVVFDDVWISPHAQARLAAMAEGSRRRAAARAAALLAEPTDGADG